MEDIAARQEPRQGSREDDVVGTSRGWLGGSGSVGLCDSLSCFTTCDKVRGERRGLQLALASIWHVERFFTMVWGTRTESSI